MNKTLKHTESTYITTFLVLSNIWYKMGTRAWSPFPLIKASETTKLRGPPAHLLRVSARCRVGGLSGSGLDCLTCADFARHRWADALSFSSRPYSEYSRANSSPWSPFPPEAGSSTTWSSHFLFCRCSTSRSSRQRCATTPRARSLTSLHLTSLTTGVPRS